MRYDYIIAGAGCAGLSLLTRLIQSRKFGDKKFLLIDKAIKNDNDRTWCFWETEPGFFEPIVQKSWKNLFFHGENFSTQLNIQPYSYKMIRGVDFYSYCLNIINNARNVTIQTGTITHMSNEKKTAVVTIDGETHEADYIFNSVLLKKPDTTHYYSILQHFKGWFVESQQALFNPNEATLMDFRVDQRHGTTFIYVLPLDERRALIEYTLFTRDLLPQEEYDKALKDYLRDFLQMESYKVEEVEFGTIPMTNFPFPLQQGRIINIGTAGGQTKASSGYTFQYIQKHSKKLTDLLIAGSPLALTKSWQQKKFNWYDSTLLNILSHRKLEGKSVFTDLFRKGDAQTVLKFLDNETTFVEDLTVMRRLPKWVFTKAALAEITSRHS